MYNTGRGTWHCSGYCKTCLDPACQWTRSVCWVTPRFALNMQLISPSKLKLISPSKNGNWYRDSASPWSATRKAFRTMTGTSRSVGDRPAVVSNHFFILFSYRPGVERPPSACTSAFSPVLGTVRLGPVVPHGQTARMRLQASHKNTAMLHLFAAIFQDPPFRGGAISLCLWSGLCRGEGAQYHYPNSLWPEKYRTWIFEGDFHFYPFFRTCMAGVKLPLPTSLDGHGTSGHD